MREVSGSPYASGPVLDERSTPGRDFLSLMMMVCPGCWVFSFLSSHFGVVIAFVTMRLVKFRKGALLDWWLMLVGP